MKKSLWIKIILSSFVILLAVIRVIYFDFASQRMDNIFLLLLISAVLIYIVPWERLTAFKAGGVEFTLDKPQVKGAIEGLGLRKIENSRLRESLSALQQEIEQTKESRVLWIDDKPHEILGERRLLRALGIEITTAKTSARAEIILAEDNDFDLIISDIQRKGELGERETIYDGIYFIKNLREKSDDQIIKSLPVIFYSAYKPEQIERIKKQVGAESLQEIEFCGTIESLVSQAIKILAEVRLYPIKVRSTKKPTNTDK
jgi:CheY-like chemotaxis protein